MTNANDLAFSKTRYKEIPHELANYPNTGLTKREYFAAIAMQGILTRGYSANQSEYMASLAIAHADALINELNK